MLIFIGPRPFGPSPDNDLFWVPHDQLNVVTHPGRAFRGMAEKKRWTGEQETASQTERYRVLAALSPHCPLVSPHCPLVPFTVPYDPLVSPHCPLVSVAVWYHGVLYRSALKCL